MIYDLDNILDRERFKRRVTALVDEGGRVELTSRKSRSLPQNAYLHLILGWFAVETGNSLEFVKREYFKRLVNADIFVRRKADKYMGEIEVVTSSKDIDSADMTTAIERFRNWSSMEAGIYLPSPNEKAFLEAIEVEISKQRNFI